MHLSYDSAHAQSMVADVRRCAPARDGKKMVNEERGGLICVCFGRRKSPFRQHDDVLLRVVRDPEMFVLQVHVRYCLCCLG